MPQESVLGPILFITYTEDLISVIESHTSTPPIDKCMDAVVTRLLVEALRVHTIPDGVQPAVTELCKRKFCGTREVDDSINFCVEPVPSVKSARDLGIYMTDADLLMRTHVQRTVSQCFAILRQLRQIRHSVPSNTFQTLVVSPVY